VAAGRRLATVRSALARLAPGPYLALAAARARRHTHRLFEGWGCLALNDVLVAQLGPRVIGGPFAGMTLTPLARRDHLGPYLLGTYEHELREVWRSLEGGRFTAVFDIGARFGYYAVGLARRYPGVPVTAVDPDRWARAATRQMAAANDTPLVRTLPRLTPRRLADALPPGALVVSDCEGYEQTLFCTREIPALRSATMLIEVHEGPAPGVTEAIAGRYAASHEVRRIASDPALPAPPVDLSFLDDAQRRLAVNEFRYPQEWLVLRPRQG
jgi:hypothetical protein